MIFHHDDEIQSPHSSTHEKHRSDDCTTRNNKNDSLHLSPPPPPATVSPRRSPRPLRSPLTNVMSRLQKLISLYDGTRTVPAVLERAVQAVFAPTAVLVITTTTTTTTTQSLSSSSPQILQGPSLWTHRFAPWNQALRRVTLHELQIVSDPHVLTFTLVVEPPSTSSSSFSNQANTDTTGTQHQAFECLVCTATVQDGQILSCMEQLQVMDHPPPVVIAGSSSLLEPKQDTAETLETETNVVEWESLPVVPARQRRRRGRRRGGGHTTEQDDKDNDNDDDKAEVVVPRDSIHASTCSSLSSSGSDLCKGTSLETIEREGGSIFLQKSAPSGGPSPAATIRKTRTNNNNINPDTVTSITIVTDQQQQQEQDEAQGSHHNKNKTLQLVELDPSSTMSPGAQFLLCDVSSILREENQSPSTTTALLFCRQQPQPSLSDQTRYFLDGHVPLWNDDTAVSHHGPDAFFPRYQLDLMDQGDGPCCRRRPIVSLWNGSRYQPMWTVCPEEEDQPDGPFYYYDSSPNHSTTTTPNTTMTTTPELLERAIQVSQTTTVSSLSSLSTTHPPYPFQPQPHSPTTPVTQQSFPVVQQPLPDVVIHVSSSSHTTTTTPKHGNNSNRPFPRTWLHMLRGKIKIPPRQDPCLMICLTALLASNNNKTRNDKHGRQFAKLRIRRCDRNVAAAAVSEDSGSSTIHNTQRPTATPKRRDRILHRLILVTDNDEEDNPCSRLSCPPPLLDPKDDDDNLNSSSSITSVVLEDNDQLPGGSLVSTQ